MKIDIVLPPPVTDYELFKRQENWWASELAQLNRYRKRIEVVERVSTFQEEADEFLEKMIDRAKTYRKAVKIQ